MSTFRDWKMAYGADFPPGGLSTLACPNSSAVPGPMDQIEAQKFYVGNDGTRYYVYLLTYQASGDINRFYLFLSKSSDGKFWNTVNPPSSIVIPGHGSALVGLAGVSSVWAGSQYSTDWAVWDFDKTHNKFYFLVLQDSNVNISSNYIFPGDVVHTVTTPTQEPDYRCQSCQPSVLIYDCTANTLTSGFLTLPSIWLTSAQTGPGNAWGPCGAKLIFNKARTNYLFFFNSLAFSSFTYLYSGTHYATTGITSNLVYVSNNGAAPSLVGFPYCTLNYRPDSNESPVHHQTFNALRFVIQDDDDIAYVFARTGSWTFQSYPSTFEQDTWYVATYNLNTGIQIDLMQMVDTHGNPYTSQIGFPFLYKDPSGNKLISLACPQNIVATIHVNSDGTLNRSISQDSVIIGISVNSTDHCPKFTFDASSHTLYLWGTQRSDGAPPYHRGVWYQSKFIPSGSFGAGGITDTNPLTDMTDSGMYAGSDTSGNEPFDIEAYNISSNMSIANMGTDYAIGFSTRYNSILPSGRLFWRLAIPAPSLNITDSLALALTESSSVSIGVSSPCPDLVDSSMSDSINYQF